MIHTVFKSRDTVFITMTVISMDADASLHGCIYARHCNECGVHAFNLSGILSYTCILRIPYILRTLRIAPAFLGYRTSCT